MSEDTYLYRCPAHGLMEAVAESPTYNHEEGEPGPGKLSCPMMMRADEECGMAVEGPFVYVPADD